MTDDVFVPEPRENRLPIHPPCGHRLLSLGCRAHHRGLGEPEPHLPTVEGMLADGTLELVPGSEDLQFSGSRPRASGGRRGSWACPRAHWTTRRTTPARSRGKLVPVLVI